MTRTVMLALFLVLVIGLLIPAYADNMSPLKQYNMGISNDMIQCNTGKVLVESSSGKPACVYEDTAKKLENRGWKIIENEISLIEYEFPISSKDFASENSEPKTWGDDFEVTISNLPKIGETAEVTVSITNTEPFDLKVNLPDETIEIQITDNFEFVDVPIDKIIKDDNILYYRVSLDLTQGETRNLSATVKAVKSGIGNVGGDAGDHDYSYWMFVDEDQTLLREDYYKLNHQPLTEPEEECSDISPCEEPEPQQHPDLPPENEASNSEPKPTEEFVTPIIDSEINKKPIFREVQQMINLENFGDYVPKTDYIQHAFTVSDWDRDELAQKLTDFTNDEIIISYQTPDNYTNYETVKGTLQIGTHAWGNSFAEYNLIGEHKIRNNVLKDFILDLQLELNFPTDNELLVELNRQHFDLYRYSQKVDNLSIKETGMIVSTDGLYTRIDIQDWFAVTDVELYDYEQAKQIAIDYALMFDELTGSECKISATDNFWHSSIMIVHGTPIYEIYAGTCEVKHAMGVPFIYYANINALTGEPLYFTTETTL